MKIQSQKSNIHRQLNERAEKRLVTAKGKRKEEKRQRDEV